MKVYFLYGYQNCPVTLTAEHKPTALESSELWYISVSNGDDSKEAEVNCSVRSDMTCNIPQVLLANQVKDMRRLGHVACSETHIKFGRSTLWKATTWKT